MMETLREWRVWLSMFLFFVYMGIEVALGSWAYTLLTESRGVSPRLAGFFMASYWGIFTVGRIVAGFYTRRVAARTLVVGSLLVALLGTALLAAERPGAGEPRCLLPSSASPSRRCWRPCSRERPAASGDRHTPNAIGIQIAAMGSGGPP